MNQQQPTAHVVLVRPQIAGNTGAIIRLCANVGARLHLVRPFGFSLAATTVKRAGLDYHELTSVSTYTTLGDALAATGTPAWAFTAHAKSDYHEVDYQLGDTVVFGTERFGLAAGDLAEISAARCLRIPMMPDNRSLNLANAASIVTYEIWRQHRFVGAGPHSEPGGSTAEDLHG